MNNYILVAAALLFSPLAMACPDCDKHREVEVTYEEEPLPVAVSETRDCPEAVSCEVEVVECCEPVDLTYHYTKPAAAFRLEQEED